MSFSSSSPPSLFGLRTSKVGGSNHAGRAFFGLGSNMRAVIPFRVHLVLDASAAVALLVVPFLFGFAGTRARSSW